jgi:hypothetical protein
MCDEPCGLSVGGVGGPPQPRARFRCVRWHREIQWGSCSSQRASPSADGGIFVAGLGMQGGGVLSVGGGAALRSLGCADGCVGARWWRIRAAAVGKVELGRLSDWLLAVGFGLVWALVWARVGSCGLVWARVGEGGSWRSVVSFREARVIGLYGAAGLGAFGARRGAVAPIRWALWRGRIGGGVAAAVWWRAGTGAQAGAAWVRGLPAVAASRWALGRGRIDAGVEAARWGCAGIVAHTGSAVAWGAAVGARAVRWDVVPA